MDIEQELLLVLDSALGLQGRSNRFSAQTPLLGALPELDSLALAGVLVAIEDHFGIQVMDEEVSGALFATVGTLADFVKQKLANS